MPRSILVFLVKLVESGIMRTAYGLKQWLSAIRTSEKIATPVQRSPHSDPPVAVPMSLLVEGGLGGMLHGGV